MNHKKIGEIISGSLMILICCISISPLVYGAYLGGGILGIAMWLLALGVVAATIYNSKYD